MNIIQEALRELNKSKVSLTENTITKTDKKVTVMTVLNKYEDWKNEKTAKLMLAKAIKTLEDHKEEIEHKNYISCMYKLQRMRNANDSAILSTLGTYMTAIKAESLKEEVKKSYYRDNYGDTYDWEGNITCDNYNYEVGYLYTNDDEDTDYKYLDEFKDSFNSEQEAIQYAKKLVETCRDEDVEYVVVLEVPENDDAHNFDAFQFEIARFKTIRENLNKDLNEADEEVDTVKDNEILDSEEESTLSIEDIIEKIKTEIIEDEKVESDFDKGYNEALNKILALINPEEAEDESTEEETELVLEEDLTRSPITPLNRDDVYSFIENVRKGEFFKIGYVKDLNDSIAKKKLKDLGVSNVLIYKMSEMYGSTGVDYENKQATIDMRAATGKERQGNLYHLDVLVDNKIFKTTSGTELLRFYPRSNSRPKVKYFISIDGSELIETTKAEIAKYLRDSVLTQKEVTDGQPSAPQTNNLKLSNIYYLESHGNVLGRSIM